MTQPHRLAAFIESVPRRLNSNEMLELVIAGDFVDFLAVEPFLAWTPDPNSARRKLDLVVAGFFAPVFDALRDFVADGHRLTIMVGNHDVEMALPAVQDALLAQLDATPQSIRFVDDGRAYHIGRLLIEHGNRYDGANLNDWTGLRAIASAQSRGESPQTELQVSAGSRIVEGIVNQLKDRYPFINLLQPAGELLAFLLLSFEPSLKWQMGMIGQLFQAAVRVVDNRGEQPGKTKYVGYLPTEQLDPELATAYGEAYNMIRVPPPVQQVSRSSDWLKLLAQSDSLSTILDRGEPIPNDRLHQIRLVMRRLLLDDRSSKWDGGTGACGKAAERMLEDSSGSFETVIMGHTHQPRHIGDSMKAHYINTGAWADVVRVPERLLADDADSELTQFLQQLRTEPGRTFLPCYADIGIAPNGAINHAFLTSATE